MKKFLILPALLVSALAYASTEKPAEKSEKPAVVECCDETCGAPAPAEKKSAKEDTKPAPKAKKR